VVGHDEQIPPIQWSRNNVVADPVMLVLVVSVGIALFELLSRLGRWLSQLISDQVALVVVPLAVRMAVFAIIGVRLSTGLFHVVEAVKLLNSIGQ
jgi:hypothetical protein